IISAQRYLPYAANLMLRVTVQITNLTGERFWGYESQLPPQVQIAVNINIVGLDLKSKSTADAPFVFAVNYNPSVAQLSVKGRAQVFGEKEEVSRMIDENKQNRRSEERRVGKECRTQ